MLKAKKMIHKIVIIFTFCCRCNCVYREIIAAASTTVFYVFCLYSH